MRVNDDDEDIHNRVHMSAHIHQPPPGDLLHEEENLLEEKEAGGIRGR